MGTLNASRSSLYVRMSWALAGSVTPTRIKIYPAAISATVLIIWVASLLNGPGITDGTSNIIGGDFAAFYTGGRFFIEGRTDELYDLVAQKAYQDSLVAPAVTWEIHPFVNPPFSVLLYAPFALPDYVTGLAVWWGCTLACLVISLRLLRGQLCPASAVSLRRLTLLAFLFFPTIMCFIYGQNTGLTLLLYTLTFVWLRCGRDGRAGFALGLLFYKPQLMIALCVVLLVKRRWRALAGVTAGVCLWCGAGLLVTPEAMGEYARISPKLFDYLRGTTNTFGLTTNYPTWGLHSFFGFSVLLLDGFSRRAADALALTLSAGAALAVALTWRRVRWQAGERQWDLMLAATVALGLLISPHLFLYDLMLLLLPLFIVCSRLGRGTCWFRLDEGPVLAATVVLYFVAFAGSYVSGGQLDATQALGLPKIAVQFSVIVMVAWVWTVYRAARSARQSSTVVAAVGTRDFYECR